jgi:hypothetical protein
MRVLPTLFSLMALVPLVPAVAGEPGAPAPRGALRGADCLDPSSARTWDYVSGDELLVDAGRRKYRVRLAEHCTELGHGAVITFKGDPVSSRVCGNAGEAVRIGRMSCRIERLEIIDADAYREATTGRTGSVSAAVAD